MNHIPINIEEKFSKLEKPWVAGIIAKMNDYHFKLVKIQGEYVWHNHPNTDEVFFVIEGEVTIEFRDGKSTLKSGEMYIVPKGVEHKPSSTNECKVMLIEPEFIFSAGGAEQEFAEDQDAWI